MSQDSPTQRPVSRRIFVGGTAAALTAASYRRVLGANDRVGLGFVGYGLIGKRHVLDFHKEEGANLVGLAEVHRGRLEEGAGQMGGKVRKYGDFRALLDDRDLDAVVISTPDHWHALMTMMACAAGKDVYVEKPMTLFVREGRWMADVARKSGRIVQVGTQQRSGPHYAKAAGLIQRGDIGHVVSVRMWSYRNIMPGFGTPPDGDPPPGLDYDLWLGPAPKRAYNPNRSIYHFRWFWDYSGGQMTNLAHHSIDIVHWYLGATAPRGVASVGGRFALRDNGETPDTQDTLLEYGGWTATWSHREASRGAAPTHGLEFCGTEGSLIVSRKGYTLTRDPKIPPEQAVPRFGSAHPTGGPASTGLTDNGLGALPALEDRTGDEFDQFRRHARNFLDCVRSRRQPASDVETGHRVSTACHLANLSLRLGRKLRWDAERETVPNDAEAAALLERPYRAPWDRQKDSLLRTV